MTRKISSIALICCMEFSLVAWGFPESMGGGNPKGTYVVESFDYKDAKNPSKDYMPSRRDFEGMVKFHSTFEFKQDGSVIQKIGEWTQEYVSEIANNNLKLYPCGNMNAKDLCVKLSKTNHDFSEYKLDMNGETMMLSQSNQTFILKLHLKKVK